MASPQRILVLGTSAGGGDWPPLAAVTVGLHQAGHAVQCFGDPAIAQEFASAGIAVEVVQAEAHLRPGSHGASGPLPLRVWAEACLPVVCALARDFRPQVVVSQLFTSELARLTKAACGVRWCCINPAYYFGPDSLRPFEADFAAPWQPKKELRQAIGEADLVLHATDALFDPPPPSFPRHHHHVGPLMWEPSSDGADVSRRPWGALGVGDRELGAPAGGNDLGAYRTTDFSGVPGPCRVDPEHQASTRRTGLCPCQCST